MANVRINEQDGTGSKCHSYHQRDTVSKFADTIFNTIRRYDLLVREHSFLHLQNNSDIEKDNLSSAFVDRTLSELVCLLNDTNVKNDISGFVRDCTENVVATCSDNGLISPSSLPRAHFYYLYCLYFAPARFINEIQKLESLFYRDMTRVYDRYVAVKTALTEMFNKITEAVLKVLFKY